MSQPELRHIALSELCISKLNMRHGRKAPDVSDLLPSIRESGVRQTLLVRREGNTFGVVAGRRRFFALKALEAETGVTPLVPCAIMPEDDAASAMAASLIENVARLPASEMEQFDAFRRLSDEGRSAESIAAFFGITELAVRRVLALARLAAPIRKLYAAEKIDRETIRALTLASPARQAEWLTLYESEDERAPTGRSCKAWITGGAAITTDKALFALETYAGEVTTDLFGGEAVFADAAAFWRAQEAAIAERAEAYRSAGWADVVLLERGEYFHSWHYVRTAKKKGGKVIMECRHDGSVTFHEGYLSQAEARRKEKAERAEPASETEPAESRAETSGPLADYLFLHRHAAAQASLVKAPAIALRLMVAHALCGSALWSVKPHQITTRHDGTRASVEGSLAVQELGQHRERIEAMFAAQGASVPERRFGHENTLCAVFAALLKLDDADMMDVLSFAMADTLASGGAIVEAVLTACETDLAPYWQPDDTFFELCRDKRAINAMIADIASPSLAASCAKDTAKAQKDVMRNRINGTACDPNPGWRPGWMQVPPKRLVEGAASPVMEAWERSGSASTPRSIESY
jgi:ParB family transcriptional regulator, chromosome partitioning protein